MILSQWYDNSTMLLWVSSCFYYSTIFQPKDEREHLGTIWRRPYKVLHSILVPLETEVEWRSSKVSTKPLRWGSTIITTTSYVCYFISYTVLSQCLWQPPSPNHGTTALTPLTVLAKSIPTFSSRQTLTRLISSAAYFCSELKFFMSVLNLIQRIINKCRNRRTVCGRFCNSLFNFLINVFKFLLLNTSDGHWSTVSHIFQRNLPPSQSIPLIAWTCHFDTRCHGRCIHSSHLLIYSISSLGKSSW